MMYAAGNKVIHPAYGAGTIVDVTEKHIGEQQCTYYVIELLTQDGTLMVPVTRAGELGLRPPVEQPEYVIKVLTSEPSLLSNDHRKRQELIGADIRSGNVLKISEAVRDLAYRDKTARLTEADHELYRRAQDFLAGELALSQDIDMATAHSQVRSVLEAMKVDEEPV
jgi:CarD family transcriptional regulator